MNIIFGICNSMVFFVWFWKMLKWLMKYMVNYVYVVRENDFILRKSMRFFVIFLLGIVFCGNVLEEKRIFLIFWEY